MLAWDEASFTEHARLASVVLSYGVFNEIYAWFLVTLVQWRILHELVSSGGDEMVPTRKLGNRKNQGRIRLLSLPVIPMKQGSKAYKA